MDSQPNFSLRITYQGSNDDKTEEIPNVELFGDNDQNLQYDPIEEDLPEKLVATKNVGLSSKSKADKLHTKTGKKGLPITNRPSLPKGTSYVLNKFSNIV